MTVRHQYGGTATEVLVALDSPPSTVQGTEYSVTSSRSHRERYWLMEFSSLVGAQKSKLRARLHEGFDLGAVEVVTDSYTGR